MTAVSLFDVLARSAAAGASPDQQFDGLVLLAGRLVQRSLSDLERLRDFEQQFGSPDLNSDSAVDVLTSVYRLYEQWSHEAGQVFSRVRTLAQGSDRIAAADQLEDAFARVRARLCVTPDKLALSVEQARQGNLVAGEKLRDELRGRLHG